VVVMADEPSPPNSNFLDSRDSVFRTYLYI
jgi:hypothetical protein